MIKTLEDLVKASHKDHDILLYSLTVIKGGRPSVVFQASEGLSKDLTFKSLLSGLSGSIPVGSIAAGWEAVFVIPAKNVGSQKEVDDFLTDMKRKIEAGQFQGLVCFNREGSPVAPVPQAPDGSTMQ